MSRTLDPTDPGIDGDGIARNIATTILATCVTIALIIGADTLFAANTPGEPVELCKALDTPTTGDVECVTVTTPATVVTVTLPAGR